MGGDANDIRFIVELLHGSAVLLSLCLLHWASARMFPREGWARSLTTGVLFAGIAVLGMLAPIPFAPGIFFDPRTVVVSAAALFGGPLVAATAGGPVIIVRLIIGGPGAVAGCLATAVAAVVGLAFRRAGKGGSDRNPLSYLAMGAIVHALGVASFLTFPEPERWRAILEFGPLYFVTFTLATLAVTTLLNEIDRSLATERALHHRDRRMSGMLSALPDMLLVIDGDGLCHEAHTSTETRLTRLRSVIEGRTLAGALEAPLVERFITGIRHSIEAHEPVEATFPLLMLEGSGWFQARAVPIGTLGNGKHGVVVLVRVVTELIQARDAAERASQVKTEFLANMSHDLRTPLNAIMGFSDMMRHELFGPLGADTYRQYVEDIHSSGELLVSLVNDVLDVSRIEAGQYRVERKPEIAAELIRSSAKLLDARARGRGQELALDIADPDLALIVDRRAILQVLNNVIGNAIKYTPNGGTVRVSLSPTPDGGAALRVADTGVGIEAAALSEVVKPFHQHHSQLSRAEHGSGLGLYISCRLMPLHDGRLSIESDVGRGTTVTLMFARHSVATPGRRRGEAPADAAGASVAAE